MESHFCDIHHFIISSVITMRMRQHSILTLLSSFLTGIDAWIVPRSIQSGKKCDPSSARFATAEGKNAEIATRPTVGSVVTIDCKLLPEGDFVPEPLIDGVVLHKDDPTCLACINSSSIKQSVMLWRM